MFKRFLTWVLGEPLAMKLRLYRPASVSPKNIVITSHIYGIDDKVTS